jgi:hypothetical protein
VDLFQTPCIKIDEKSVLEANFPFAPICISLLSLSRIHVIQESVTLIYTTSRLLLETLAIRALNLQPLDIHILKHPYIHTRHARKEIRI